MTADVEALQLRVLEARLLCPQIRLLRLAAADGAPLPAFKPGAHIRVRVQADRGGPWRHYSLVQLEPDAAALQAPQQYTIAVRLEADGRGGSRFMHERVQVGDTLAVLAPRNDFALIEDGSAAVLVAGGIGITPLATMASWCIAHARPVRMYYAGRSRAAMAFVEPLARLLGPRLTLHTDDTAGGPLDAAAIVARLQPSERLYVCGPRPMLDSFLAAAQRHGWPRERLHFELFSAPAVAPDAAEVEIELARTRRTLRVPADKSILDALLEAGCDLPFDCRRGECGVCRVDVLDGDIDHRDYVLTDAEHAAGNVMQVCVSRARSRRLVLDL